MADEIWTSKIGTTAKILRLGLLVDGSLISFGSLAGPGGGGLPQLRIRLPHETQAEARSFDVTAYTDEPTLYNAQRIWEPGDFTGAGAIVPGTYLAEIDATLAGESVTFPDGSYLRLKFLRGVDE